MSCSSTAPETAPHGGTQRQQALLRNICSVLGQITKYCRSEDVPAQRWLVVRRSHCNTLFIAFILYSKENEKDNHYFTELAEKRRKTAFKLLFRTEDTVAGAPNISSAAYRSHSLSDAMATNNIPTRGWFPLKELLLTKPRRVGNALMFKAKPG